MDKLYLRVFRWFFFSTGRGDIIYCEFKSPCSKPRATASLTVQANTHIHYIEWSDLLTIFEKFPMFREDFLNRRVFSYQIGDYVKVGQPIFYGKALGTRLKVGSTEGGLYSQTIYRRENNGSCLGSIV